MAFRLEITAATVTEFHEELHGLVALLAGTSGIAVSAVAVQPQLTAQMAAAAEANGSAAEDKPEPARRTRARKEPEPQPQPEVAETAATGEAGPGATTAAPSEAEDPAPEASSSTSAESTASDAGADGPATTVDQLRELTLKVVAKCGREGIEKVLNQFGIQRATQVPDEQRDELAAALQDALEAA